MREFLKVFVLLSGRERINSRARERKRKKEREREGCEKRMTLR